MSSPVPVVYEPNSPGASKGKDNLPNENVDDNYCGRRVFQVPFSKKEQLRCLVCGGKDCPKCGLNAYKSLSNPAIKMLHSHWINDSIVGMQRPNDIALDNGALEDMVAKKITAIFNLTEPGEHPYCGTGVINETGFPFSPEKLMSAGIKHFNFSWRDMTVPSMQMMMDIVFIACNELNAGGKIAIHCHAGFGRTGITIACILIAKERLPATSVVQFVRNRRPGSVQTSAQQQFVQRFEKAYSFMMQIFPVMDESQQQFQLDKSGPSSSSSPNLMGSSFKGLPLIGSASISNAPTPATSPAIRHHTADTQSPHAPSNHPRKKSVVMFYSKSISQSAKDQLHFLSSAEAASRKFTYSSKIVLLTTLAIGRLVHDNFHFACLAITGLTKLAAKNTTDVHTHGKTIVRADQTIGISSKLIHKKSNFMVALNSLSASSEEGLLRDIKIDLNGNFWTRLKSYMDVVGTTIRTNDSLSKLQNSNSVAKLNPSRSSKEISSSDLNKATSSQSAPKVDSKSKLDITPNKAEDNDKHDNSQTSKSENHSKSSSDNQKKDEDSFHSNRSLTNNNASKLPPIINGKPTLASIPSMSNLMKKSLSFSSPPGSPQQHQANTSHNHHQSKISVTQLKRVNSLKQTSEADFSKSRKIASNIVSQLLLDWLETRQDPLFSPEIITKLTDLWRLHGQNSKMDKVNVESSAKSKDELIAEKKEDQVVTLLEEKVVDEGMSIDLFAEINKCLLTHLDRYKLELLDSLVQMYISVRAAAKKWTDVNHHHSMDGSDSARVEGSNEADALDALVGLRFTIAMMHARKDHNNLVRHRALLMDVVKVFLLKSARSEVVLINNIVFTEENYYQIENTIGATLLCSLDVVFRTFRLLTDFSWHYNHYDSSDKVGWRGDLLSKQDDLDDEDCIRSFHSGDGGTIIGQSSRKVAKPISSQSTEQVSSDSDEHQ